MGPYSAAGGTSGGPNDDEGDGMTAGATSGTAENEAVPSSAVYDPADPDGMLLSRAFPAPRGRVVPVDERMFVDPGTDDDMWTGSWAAPKVASPTDTGSFSTSLATGGEPHEPAGYDGGADGYDPAPAPREGGSPAFWEPAPPPPPAEPPTWGPPPAYVTTPRPAGPADAPPERPAPPAPTPPAPAPPRWEDVVPRPAPEQPLPPPVPPAQPEPPERQPAAESAPQPESQPPAGEWWPEPEDRLSTSPTRDRWAGLRPAGRPLSEVAGYEPTSDGLWTPHVPVDAAPPRADAPQGNPPQAEPPRREPPRLEPPQVGLPRVGLSQVEPPRLGVPAWQPPEPATPRDDLNPYGNDEPYHPSGGLGEDAAQGPYDPDDQPWRADDGYPPDWPYRKTGEQQAPAAAPLVAVPDPPPAPVVSAPPLAPPPPSPPPPRMAPPRPVPTAEAAPGDSLGLDGAAPPPAPSPRLESFSGVPGASDPDTFSDLSGPLPLPRTHGSRPSVPGAWRPQRRRMTSDPATGLRFLGGAGAGGDVQSAPADAVPPAAGAPAPYRPSVAEPPAFPTGEQPLPDRPMAPADRGIPDGPAVPGPSAPVEPPRPVGSPAPEPESSTTGGSALPPLAAVRALRGDTTQVSLPGLPDATGWEWNSLYRPEVKTEAGVTGTQPIAGMAIRIDWENRLGDGPNTGTGEDLGRISTDGASSSMGAAFRRPDPWDAPSWAGTGGSGSGNGWEELADPFTGDAEEPEERGARRHGRVLAAAAVAVVVAAGVAVAAQTGLIGHNGSNSVNAASVSRGATTASATPAVSAAPTVVTAADGTAVSPPIGTNPEVMLSAGPSSASTYRYAVDVQVGLPIDAYGFANQVDGILNDPRGWNPAGGFRRVDDPRNADFTIMLVDQTDINTDCSIIAGNVPPAASGLPSSCQGAGGLIVLSIESWMNPPPSVNASPADYQAWLINRLVGASYGLPLPATAGRGACGSTDVMSVPGGGAKGCRVTPWPGATDREKFTTVTGNTHT